MLRPGRGSIINIASIGGFVAYPHATAVPGKGGVVQLTRGLALEWVGRGVRVNAHRADAVRDPADGRRRDASTVTSDFIRARMLGRPRGAAARDRGAAIFLAGDASALVTGHVLPVDDGYLIA